MMAFIVAPLVLGLLLFFATLVLFSMNRMGTVTSPGKDAPPAALNALAKRTSATGSDFLARGGALAFEAHGVQFRITASDFTKTGAETLWVGATLRESDGGGAYRGARGGVALTEPIERLPHLVCRLESNIDKLGKRLGLNRELEAGDAAFDASIYVESSARGPATQALLSMIASTGAARDITAIGGDLVLQGEGHHVALRLSKHGQPFDPAPLDRAVEAVAAVVSGMPPIRDRALTGAPRGLRAYSAAGTILVALTAAFAIGISLDLRVLGLGFVGLCAKVAAGVFAFLVLVIWLVSRGRVAGFARFAQGTALAIAFTPSLAGASMTLADRIGDDTSRRVRTTVIEKRLSKGKNSTTYYVTVGPWEGHPEEEEIKVPRDAYDRTVTGSTYELELANGRLGYAWMREAYLVE